MGSLVIKAVFHLPAVALAVGVRLGIRHSDLAQLPVLRYFRKWLVVIDLHLLHIAAVNVAAPHPVPELVVEQGGILWFELVVNLHQLVTVSLADNLGTITWFSIDIHLVDGYPGDIPVILVRIAGHEGGESQGAQGKTAQLQEIAPR